MDDVPEIDAKISDDFDTTWVLWCSAHAQARQARRNISDIQLAYVLRHGIRLNRTGVTFIVLRQRDIPVADRRIDRWAKLAGTVALVGHDGTVITVYRNQAALCRIHQKQKHRRRR